MCIRDRLSGVGPQEHLNELGIKTIQNLNVGKNLQDHMLMTGLVITYNITKSNNLVRSMFEFLTESSGILGNVGMLNEQIFINTGLDSKADIQFHILDFSINSQNVMKPIVKKALGFKPEIATFFLELIKNSSLSMAMPTLLRPKSKGEILLESQDPLKHPKIISGYLTHNDDIETYLKSCLLYTSRCV